MGITCAGLEILKRLSNRMRAKSFRENYLEMNDQPLNFTLESSCETPLADVIFVHGLKGNAHDTWVWERNAEEFWPAHLAEECGSVNVYSLGYPASVLKGWAQKEMDLFERAASALDYIVSCEIGQRPLVLIGHSMGGLLIKAPRC